LDSVPKDHTGISPAELVLGSPLTLLCKFLNSLQPPPVPFVQQLQLGLYHMLHAVATAPSSSLLQAKRLQSSRWCLPAVVTARTQLAPELYSLVPSTSAWSLVAFKRLFLWITINLILGRPFYCQRFKCTVDATPSAAAVVFFSRIVFCTFNLAGLCDSLVICYV
jgi:hypothetical protein